MSTFTVNTSLPKVPEGYFWKSSTEEKYNRIFYVIRLYREGRVLGIKTALPIEFAVGDIAASNAGSLETHMYTSAVSLISKAMHKV
jgi:hypothetical protein